MCFSISGETLYLYMIIFYSFIICLAIRMCNLYVYRSSRFFHYKKKMKKQLVLITILFMIIYFKINMLVCVKILSVYIAHIWCTWNEAYIFNINHCIIFKSWILFIHISKVNLIAIHYIYLLLLSFSWLLLWHINLSLLLSVKFNLCFSHFVF
jgi:hypothetical protein